MTAPQPFPVEEALAFVNVCHNRLAERFGEGDNRFDRLKATLRQLSAPRPVPAPIGELIDRLARAWKDFGEEAMRQRRAHPGTQDYAALDVAADRATAARAALEAAITEPSEQLEAEVRKLVIRHFGSLDSWVPLGDVVRLIRAQVNQDQCVPRKRA